MTAGWLRFHRRAGRAAVAATIVFGFAAPAAAIKIGNSKFEAVDWTKLDGWAEDNHLIAFGRPFAPRWRDPSRTQEPPRKIPESGKPKRQPQIAIGGGSEGGTVYPWCILVS